MNEEIKNILKILKKCEWSPCLTKHDATTLLDYITNLQEENERLKDELSQEKKDFKEANDKCFELMNYKSRIDKAIDNIDITIELIKQQPTEDDTWILNRLNGFKYLLQGDDKDDK